MSLLWATVFGMAGLLAFIGLPLLVGPSLDVERRHGIARRYFKLCMVALDRGGIIERKHGGVDLVGSKFDPKKQAEKVSIGGKTGHFEDRHGLMSRFMHRPFFSVHESSNVVLSPILAEIGEKERERVENGRAEFELEDGSKGFSSHLVVPDAERFVSLKNAIWILPGSADPFLGDLAEEFVRKSQLGFNTRNVIEIMTGVVVFGVCFGIVALAMKYGGAVPNAPNVPTVPLGYLGGWL